MRLLSAHISKFKSVNDSTEFDLTGDVTALVGKNESGKTAALEALYRVTRCLAVIPPISTRLPAPLPGTG